MLFSYGSGWHITDLGSKNNSTGETTLELDSNADTCVLGFRPWCLNVASLLPTCCGWGIWPIPWHKTYATVSGALADDDPQTGKVNHIVINQAIHIPHLDQVDDVTVDKTQNVLARDPTDHTSHWPYETRRDFVCFLRVFSMSNLINI